MGASAGSGRGAGTGARAGAPAPDVWYGRAQRDDMTKPASSAPGALGRFAVMIVSTSTSVVWPAPGRMVKANVRRPNRQAGPNALLGHEAPQLLLSSTAAPLLGFGHAACEGERSAN